MNKPEQIALIKNLKIYFENIENPTEFESKAAKYLEEFYKYLDPSTKSESKNQAVRDRYHTLKQMGLCVSCGKKKETSLMYCNKCREYRKFYYSRKYIGKRIDL